MAKSFLVPIDLNGNEVQNFLVHLLASDPGSPAEGQMWINTTSHVLKYYDGTTTQSLFELSASDVLTLLLTVDGAGSGLDADLLDGEQGTHYLDRANHTGTQAISTIATLQSALDAKVDESREGVANGIATLDSGGKIPVGQLPDAAFGGLNYLGTWNASTNTPALSNGSGDAGDFYKVGTAGTTNIDGISDWQVGDWIISDGTAWQKIDNTDLVSSVNGQTGVVVLDAGDIGYSNGTSGLSATDVQAAIDELASAPSGSVNVYNETIGDGSATQIDVTHNLGTRDVIVSIREVSAPYAHVEADVSSLDTNNVRIEFADAPASGEYRVTVLG